VDRHDLWGRSRYPSITSPEDVPQFYRLAAARRGVFANPPLTEPFGLTLIEAAACGLPIVATADGGPRDIVGACENGVLVDPLDTADIAAGLEAVLSDAEAWQRLRAGASTGVATPLHLGCACRQVPDPRRSACCDAIASRCGASACQHLLHNPMPYSSGAC
jgi:sucrose-phosphate synthase